ERAEVGDLQLAVLERVAHRVLHEGVRDDDEVTGDPGAGEERGDGREMRARPELLLAVDDEAKEGRPENEGKDAFHRERLPDDAARESGEARPVGAELEFERDAGRYADGEVDAEHAQPEARRRGRFLVVLAQRADLEEQREEREAHGELREEIMEGDGEAELQTVPE